LDSHVDLTLTKLLGIAKREFHDTIVDLIKRKHQQSDEEEVRMNAITMAKTNEETDSSEKLMGSHFPRPHWARATTETPVKIGERKETVVALINHGSEINLMSMEFYK
jgi:hypothetical protein